MIKNSNNSHCTFLPKNRVLGLVCSLLLAPTLVNALPTQPVLEINGSMDFGSTFFGEHIERTIELNNVGPGDITVEDLGFTNNVQITPMLPFNISEGDSQSVTISFASDLRPVFDKISNGSFDNIANGIKTEPQAQLPSMTYYHSVEDTTPVGWYYQGGVHANDNALLKPLLNHSTMAASPDKRFIYLHGADTHKNDSLWVLEVSENSQDIQVLRVVQTESNLLRQLAPALWSRSEADYLDYSDLGKTHITVSPDGKYIAINDLRSVVVMRRQANNELIRIYPTDENMGHGHYSPDMLPSDRFVYESVNFHPNESMIQLKNSNDTSSYLLLHENTVFKLSEHDARDGLEAEFDQEFAAPNSSQYGVNAYTSANGHSCQISLFKKKSNPPTPPLTWLNDCQPWKKTTLKDNPRQTPLHLVQHTDNLYLIEYDHFSHFKIDSTTGEVIQQSRERYRELRDTNAFIHVEHEDGQQKLIALRDSGFSQINLSEQGELDLSNADHNMQTTPSLLITETELKEQHHTLKKSEQLYLSPNEHYLVARGKDSLSVYRTLDKPHSDGRLLINTEGLHSLTPSPLEHAWLEGEGGAVAFSEDSSSFFFIGPNQQLLWFYGLWNDQQNLLNWGASAMPDSFKSHISAPITDIFVGPDDKSVFLIDNNPNTHPTVMRVQVDTSLSQGFGASYLSLPVSQEEREKAPLLYAMSPDRQQIAVASFETLTFFKQNDQGNWDFIKHFEHRFQGGLKNIGAIAFSPNGKFLYTVTKQFTTDESEPYRREQFIMVFSHDEQGQWQWLSGLEGSNNVTGGTDLQFSNDGLRLFVSATPSIYPNLYQTDAFQPDIYYTNPETGDLSLISKSERVQRHLAQKTRAAIGNNGNRLYTIAHGNLAVYDKVRLEAPVFTTYKDRGEAQPRFSTQVTLLSKGDSFIDLELSDFIITDGYASDLVIEPSTDGLQTIATFTLKPELGLNGGSLTINLPSDRYLDERGKPNAELTPVTLDFYPSLIPRVSTEKAVNYGDTTKIIIDFGQAVEDFNKHNFPWTLFEAELLEVKVLETGYELTITATHNRDGVASFVVEDGVLSAKNNPAIKNFAISKTDITIKMVK